MVISLDAETVLGLQLHGGKKREWYNVRDGAKQGYVASVRM